MHLIIFALHSIFSKCNTQGIWLKCWSFIKWLIKKLFYFLTFGYYIRVILEMNQFILVLSFYEIHNFNISHPIKIVSLTIAITIFILWLMFISIVFLLSISSYQVTENEHNLIGELFTGVKMSIKCKLYISVLLIRRASLIILLICLTMISWKLLIGLTSFLQLGYLVYIIYVHPFKEVKWNIIEIINEIYFLLHLSFLIHFNTKDIWKSHLITAYCMTITSNSLVVLAIILGKIFKLNQNSWYNQTWNYKIIILNWIYY